MNVRKNLLILFSLAGIAINSVYAGDENKTDTTVTSEIHSHAEREQQPASQWKLSDQEWSRYQALKKSPRAVQSPGIDPVMALGLESTSVTERRHFAELWVKQEALRVEKELAFQREVDAAWQRLYPNLLPVNIAGTGLIKNTSLPEPVRLTLFVRQNCAAECDALLARALADGRPVDIYVTDSGGNDMTVRQWALSHHIPVEQVQTRHITLNHDTAGYWQKFAQGKMPVVLIKGEKGWQVAFSG